MFAGSGLLKIAATCADAEVRYPTDLDQIHDGVEIMDRIIGRISTMAAVVKPKEQQTKEYQQSMAKNVGERNEVEATFGIAKRIYRANNIRAKLSDIGTSWTACCYFAKNVMKFLRELLYALILMIRKMEISVVRC